MPNHFLSDKILAYYLQAGVATNTVIKSGERIGACYLNQGTDIKNIGVIYNRKTLLFF